MNHGAPRSTAARTAENENEIREFADLKDSARAVMFLACGSPRGWDADRRGGASDLPRFLAASEMGLSLAKDKVAVGGDNQTAGLESPHAINWRHCSCAQACVKSSCTSGRSADGPRNSPTAHTCRPVAIQASERAPSPPKNSKKALVSRALGRDEKGAQDGGDGEEPIGKDGSRASQTEDLSAPWGLMHASPEVDGFIQRWAPRAQTWPGATAEHEPRLNAKQSRWLLVAAFDLEHIPTRAAGSLTKSLLGLFGGAAFHLGAGFGSRKAFLFLLARCCFESGVLVLC